MNFISVEKTVACSRCGESGLAWLRSKAGKPYLVKATQRSDGTFEAARNAFHKCANATSAGAPRPLPSTPAPPKTPPAPVPDALTDLLARVARLEAEVARLRGR